MAVALGLGVLASLAFLVSANVYAYAALFVAGVVAAWLVPDRGRGVVGLVLGIVGAYAVRGTNEVKRVDVVPIVLGALLSFALLATAGWLTRRHHARLAGIVPFGAVAAVLAGLQPLMAVVWLVEQGNLTAGPIELAIGVLPLVWALLIASVALAAWRRGQAVFAR